MKVEEPFFSVVIATYNRADLLERALNSLIQQSMVDWEAIIVDDGSEDDTLKLLETYLEENNKIHYYKKKHSGVALTKNKGIELSKGKYITFLDSDDAYKLNHLKLRQECLLQNKEVEFLHGGVKVLGDKYVPDRFNSLNRIHLSDCKVGGTFFIKRATLLSLNGFRNISLGEDADLLDRAKDAKKKLMKVDFPTYIYHREHKDSLTKNFFKSRNFMKQ